MHSDKRYGFSRRGVLAGLLSATAIRGTWLSEAAAKDALPAAREIPAHPLPIPDTVSDRLKLIVGAPLPADWNVIPKSKEAWRALSQASGKISGQVLAAIQRNLRVTVKSDMIGGVPVFVSTPDDLPAANQDHVLMHLHGGGYVLYPGEVGAGEGMMMAGYGRFRVISVDYRLAPEFPFPAAIDDAISVWKALLTQNDPRKMAIFGTSAGGGLTLATLLRAKADGLPFPAAIAPGSPWTDLTGRGDSLFANAFVDNVLVSMDGWAGATAKIYAAGQDLRNPLISPIYGDFANFPPASEGMIEA